MTIYRGQTQTDGAKGWGRPCGMGTHHPSTIGHHKFQPAASSPEHILPHRLRNLGRGHLALGQFLSRQPRGRSTVTPAARHNAVDHVLNYRADRFPRHSQISVSDAQPLASEPSENVPKNIGEVRNV